MLKYKGFSLIKPNAGQRVEINLIIENQFGSVFQDVELNEIVQKHFKTELFYLVDNPNNIKNLTPVHIQKSKFGLKRYHFKPLYDIPYAGFVDESNIKFNEISVGLFESYVYCGLPATKKSNNNESSLNNGETSFIDLSLDEDDIFNGVIHSKRRNMIRKAIKSGIVIKKYTNDEGLKYFWPILDELHNKLGYSHLKEDYYKDIVNTYGPKNQAYILVAFKEGIPVSGIFILGNKNYMLYYKGSSKFGAKNEGQNELLQWEAIKICKSIGVNYYDLGNLDKQNLPHIYKFKTGISNNIVNFPIYTKSSLGYKVVNKFF